MKNIWIFLEPYSFIFEGVQGYVIYNTLNGEIIKSNNSKTINNIIKEIKESDRYGIRLEENIFKENDVFQFIKKLRETFTGDFIETDVSRNEPFIFKPILDLLNAPFINDNKEENRFDKEEVVKYLHEISLFLGGKCKHKCEQCSTLYKQTTFCTISSSNDLLTKTNYEELFIRLKTIGLKKIKLIVNNFDLSFVVEIITLMNLYELYPDFYINYINFDLEKFSHLCNNVKISNLYILVNKELPESIEKVSQTAKWIFLIDNENDLLRTNSFIETKNINAKIVPVYTKTNTDFFESFVYTTLDDLKSQILGKKEIFARQVLNETMFGKLSIMADGSVFASVNKQSLGNIKYNSLNELIHKELTNKESWLYTRDQSKCSECVYKYLCPSPSDYEFFIGKTNLCTI